MHRTTVMLPPELKARAVIRARKLGLSLGELIRRSLRETSTKGSPAGAADSMYDDAAVYGGPAPRDLSAAHDSYLYGPKG